MTTDRYLRLILTVIACCLGAASTESRSPAEAKASAIAQSLETFSGTWEIVTVEPPGVTVTTPSRSLAERGTLCVYAPIGQLL